MRAWRSLYHSRCTEPEQHLDAPHLVALLPTCGKWPRRDATHQDDELAPPSLQLPVSGVAS